VGKPSSHYFFEKVSIIRGHIVLLTCSDELKELTPIEEAEFFELRHCASKLDPHYIETHYPDATAGNQAPYKYYDCERSEECPENARRLLEWAGNQIQ
jgi:HEPN domain-containing protein